MTGHDTIASAPAPEHEQAQGTVLPPVPVPDDTSAVVLSKRTVVPKRNHNRRPESKYRGGELTVEQQQQVTTMAAAGHSAYRISQTMGKGINMVKRHLETPEVIAEVQDERAELVELYREKARDCVVAIDDEKIQKSSALQLATSSGILLDKSLLLSGQPTAIHVHALVDVLDTIRQLRDEREEREDEEARAAAKARALLSAPASQP